MTDGEIMQMLQDCRYDAKSIIMACDAICLDPSPEEDGVRLHIIGTMADRIEKSMENYANYIDVLGIAAHSKV